MILLIDNYDSFTYNLYQALSSLGAEVEVRRNDAISVADVRAWSPEGIVLSPGPGDPSEAGISVEVVRELGAEIPTLGVCLGHQCIATAFGGRVIRAAELMHGKTSQVFHRDIGLMSGLPSPFQAVRYHSLAVDDERLPDDLEVTAETGSGIIMGLRHREYPIEGVQFHPESIASAEGPLLLANWLRSVQGGAGSEAVPAGLLAGGERPARDEGGGCGAAR